MISAEHQILIAVIGAVAVQMMYALRLRQRASESLLHHPSMFHHLASTAFNADVPARRYLSTRAFVFARTRQTPQCFQSTRVRAVPYRFDTTELAAAQSEVLLADGAVEVVPNDARGTAEHVSIHEQSIPHSISSNALPGPLWDAIRVWRADMPPPAEVV